MTANYKKYLALFEECLTQPYINSSEAGSYYWQIDGDTLKMWSSAYGGKIRLGPIISISRNRLMATPSCRGKFTGVFCECLSLSNLT